MRWIFRLLGLVVLLAVFAVGAVFFLPKERIAAIAADQVRAQTGRELVLTGDLSLSFWPVLGVSTGPMILSNADWAGAEPMVSAKSLSIGVDAAALLGGNVQIKHIEAESPTVRLATRADGRGNWEFGAAPVAAEATSEGSTTRSFTLERISLSDASLIYVPAEGDPRAFSGVDAVLNWPVPEGPAAFSGSVTLGTAPLELSGSLDSFAAFLEGAVAPLRLAAATEGGRFSFDGRANMAGEVAGRMEISTEATDAFLAGLGAGGAAPPEGLGRRMQAAADVTVTGGNRISLRDLSLDLDQNRLAGAADLVLGDVPNVTAQLTARALDLSGLVEGGTADGAAEAGSATSGWSTAPIDASALGLINGDISLVAQSIDLGPLALGTSRLGLTIDRSRAVLNLNQIEVFDGVVTGQLVANNRSGLSVGGDVQASEIEMEQMLGDLIGVTRLSGRTDTQIEFLGVGQSMDAIMKSLSGQGSVAMGRGVISGFDLDRLMRTGDGSGGTTVFDSLTAGFSMQEGNLLNDDLLVLLANFRAEGAGRIGLGSRDIDYLFTPIALRANSGQGLAIPVRIRGPWSAPRIVPDLSEALQLDVDGKVEEIKQDARDQVQQKLEEELGVTRQDGQSTEDALKDALEERARDGLRRLLGGE